MDFYLEWCGRKAHCVLWKLSPDATGHLWPVLPTHSWLRHHARHSCNHLQPQPHGPSALFFLVPSLPDSYRATSSKSLHKYQPPNETRPNCPLVWQSFLLPFGPKASCCIWNSPWRQTGTQNTHQHKHHIHDITDTNDVCKHWATKTGGCKVHPHSTDENGYTYIS